MANVSPSRELTSRTTPLRPAPARSPTGIPGFDYLSGGGLPTGRTTLIAGGPGTGKTIFAMQFLRHGALELGETGILISCQESTEVLIENAAVLDWELDRLVASGKLTIIDASPTTVATPTGDFDLNGLFARVDHLISTRGATRIAVDAPRTLLALYGDRRRETRELREFHRWIADRQLTAIITGTPGRDQEDSEAGRNQVDQAVDCLVSLDQRTGSEYPVIRVLRVVKYRGSACDPIDVPFVITSQGISLCERDP
jgi:circadian clock protein KaiC